MASEIEKRKKADALVLPFFEGKKAAFPVSGLSNLFSPGLNSGDFSGSKGEILCLYPKSTKETRVVLIGLGKEKELACETLRRSYGKAIAFLKGKAKSANLVLPAKNDPKTTRAVAEGALLANYVYDTNKAKKDKYLESMTFIDADEAALEESQKLCESVYFARNLAFSNADDITPTHLAAVAQDLAKSSKKVQTKVLGKKEIQKEKLGLLEAVSRGSHEDPALILVEYKGNPKSKETIALVGKGVTYDTGGLNLKPTGGIETMRDDMSGAAAVLGTMHAVIALNLPINVIGVVGSTENAIGPKSYKPGDVYKSHKGITVEVTNTDAEGRLVLADAISYVQDKYAPKKIVDIATLTGGAIIALGEDVSAIMSNDEELAEDLIQAGEETYERLWPLPLYEEYDQILKSTIADIKNSGKRKASPIQGGIFLKKFIEKAQWAHIDIAGTAFPDEARQSYHPIQSTGVGVRLLTAFLKNEANRSS